MIGAGALPAVGLRSGEVADDDLAALRYALLTGGVCYLTGHGADAAVGRALAASRALFARPEATKRACASRGPTDCRGYEALPERDGDWREGFFCTHGVAEGDGAFPLAGPARWPDDLEFRAAMTDCAAALCGVAGDLVAAVARALGLPELGFRAALVPPGGVGLRALRYPPLADAPVGVRWGVSPHSDLPPLALIAQDEVGGLEVRGEGDDEWIAVPPRPGALVVQFGDALHQWTGGRSAINVHRVVNRSAHDRHSLACFALPAPDTALAPPGSATDATPRFGRTLADWLHGLERDPRHVGAVHERTVHSTR